MNEQKLRTLFAQLAHTTPQNVSIEFVNSAVSKKFSQATTSKGIRVDRESLRTFQAEDDEIFIVEFEPGTPRTVESDTRIIYAKPQYGATALVWGKFEDFKKAYSETQKPRAEA